jgi:hypothetical protein
MAQSPPLREPLSRPSQMPRPSIPAVSLAEVNETLRRLMPATSLPHRCEVGPSVLAALRSTQPRQAGYGGAIGDLVGIPVVLDCDLDTDEWRLVDQDGNVLHSGRG